MTSGPATQAELQDLHRELTRSLVRRLNHQDARRPGADVMDVARALLKQEGLAGLAQTQRDRDRLRRLHRLLAEQLLDALSSAGPTPALMAVALGFLRDNGVSKDLDSALSQVSAIQRLTAADLPFKTN